VRTIFTTALVAAVAVACDSAGEPTFENTARVQIATADGPVTVDVEVADDDEERARGLMERTSLADDAGMAFLWEQPVETSFWMKNTLIPLSIAFWDRRGRIIHIEDMEPCREDSCPRYRPDQPFVGALEVNQGFFEEHGAEVGDRVMLLGTQ
jgi:uncharacterized membrane protein (UPF0127 family)